MLILKILTNRNHRLFQKSKYRTTLKKNVRRDTAKTGHSQKHLGTRLAS